MQRKTRFQGYNVKLITLLLLVVGLITYCSFYFSALPNLQERLKEIWCHERKRKTPMYSSWGAPSVHAPPAILNSRQICRYWNAPCPQPRMVSGSLCLSLLWHLHLQRNSFSHVDQKYPELCHANSCPIFGPVLFRLEGCLDQYNASVYSALWFMAECSSSD